MQLAPGLMYVPGLTVQDALHVFLKKKEKKNVITLLRHTK